MFNIHLLLSADLSDERHATSELVLTGSIDKHKRCTVTLKFNLNVFVYIASHIEVICTANGIHKCIRQAPEKPTQKCTQNGTQLVFSVKKGLLFFHSKSV